MDERIALFKRNVESKLDVVKFGLKVEFVSSENWVWLTVNGELWGTVDVVDVADLGKTDLLDLVYLIPDSIGYRGVRTSVASLAFDINIYVWVSYEVSSLLATDFPGGSIIQNCIFLSQMENSCVLTNKFLI